MKSLEHNIVTTITPAERLEALRYAQEWNRIGAFTGPIRQPAREGLLIARALLAEHARVEALEAALLELELDQHAWSNRPCSTCRKASAALGRDFGCLRYDAIHEAQTVMLKTGDPAKYRAALSTGEPS